MTTTLLHDDYDDHDDLRDDSLLVYTSASDVRPFTPFKASQVATLLAEANPPIPTSRFMEHWRTALCQEHLQHAARSLGVPEDFICEFNPGWIEELGSLALASIDERGVAQGIEVVGVDVPQDTILDRSVIVGAPAGVVPTITARPGAPLVISSSWTDLHEHWESGANCGWQCLHYGSAQTLVAIDRHAERIGASEVVFDSDRLREGPLREIFIDLRESDKARHLRRNVM
jgi:hypothetical protein